MNQKKITGQLEAKIVKGLKLSYQRLLAEKSKNNLPIVIMENGIMVKKVPSLPTNN